MDSPMESWIRLLQCFFMVVDIHKSNFQKSVDIIIHDYTTMATWSFLGTLLES